MKRWLRAAGWAAAAALVAAAVWGRQACPEGAQAAQAWLMGPEGNRVSAAFSAMEGAIGDGVGEAVSAFCAEMSGSGCS